MEKEPISQTTTEDQLADKNKSKNDKIVKALFIGFLAGVFFVAVAAGVSKGSAAGLVAVGIPLFLIYKIARKPKKDKGPKGLAK